LDKIQLGGETVKNINNYGLIDLHIHTNNSDGELSTKDIIKKLEERNITTFSITDHDNIDSYEEVIKENTNELYYIKGIEISSILSGYNIHVLGYDFNDKCNKIQKIILNIANNRKLRILEITDILKSKYDINFNQEDIIQILNKKGAVGKPHIVELLNRYGYGSDNNEIYQKYLKGIKSETKYRISANKAIDSIRSDDGIAILAHPKDIENEYNIDLEKIIKNLIEIGINGIEVYNSLHNLDDIKRYLNIAKKYNLLVSGGSDYHGIFTKPNVELGNVSQEKINIKTLSIVDYIKSRH
jgi:predicted metal-dependent phosphoesterase TrpH